MFVVIFKTLEVLFLCHVTCTRVRYLITDLGDPAQRSDQLPELHLEKIMPDSLICHTDTLPLTKFLTTFPRALHLTIGDAPPSYAPGNTSFSREQTELLFILDRCESVSIRINHWSNSLTRPPCPMSLESVLASSKNIRAVHLVDGNRNETLHLETMPAYISKILRQTATDTAWKALEELQVNVMHLLPIEAQESGQSFWQQQELWSRLRRLSVDGPAQSFDRLFHHAGSLLSLVSLKLRFTAPPDRLEQVPEITPSPFLQLNNLREVELELVGSQLRSTYFANGKLRRWKCYSQENTSPWPGSPFVKLERTPDEVASLVNLCPMLEEVELNVGMISNL
jgi:hypothetical protein